MILGCGAQPGRRVETGAAVGGCRKIWDPVRGDTVPIFIFLRHPSSGSVRLGRIPSSPSAACKPVVSCYQFGRSVVVSDNTV